MTAQPPPPSRYHPADSFERNLQRIRLRQDTEENWLKNDPIPASGELCYTIGSGDPGQVLKVGDGTVRWSNLSYLAATGASGPPGAPGQDGHGITVYGPSDSPPSPDNTQLYEGDMWLSNGIYAQNPSFDPALIPPKVISDLGDVEISAPAAGELLKYDDQTGTWRNSPPDENGEWKSKAVSVQGFRVRKHHGSSLAPPLYAQAPAGANEVDAECHGFVQVDSVNFCVQPYIYFADGTELNFSTTTKIAHAHHQVRYDADGLRDTGDTFVQNHGCRWTFKNQSNYDVKGSHPLFFSMKAYKIGSCWEITWSGSYLSANNTPMSFSGGLEYNSGQTITRMGVKTYPFNSDSCQNSKGTVIFEGV